MGKGIANIAPTSSHWDLGHLRKIRVRLRIAAPPSKPFKYIQYVLYTFFLVLSSERPVFARSVRRKLLQPPQWLGMTLRTLECVANIALLPIMIFLK